MFNLAPEMKKRFSILLLAVVVLFSCDKEHIEKPDKLIKKDRMIEMLVDIHMAESTFNHLRYDSLVKNSSSANFYYSILEKYEVPDSVFERSFIYYAGQPRLFEKMYREVMNVLSETEQEYSGRKNELLEFDDSESQQ